MTKSCEHQTPAYRSKELAVKAVKADCCGSQSVGGFVYEH